MMGNMSNTGAREISADAVETTADKAVALSVAPHQVKDSSDAHQSAPKPKGWVGRLRYQTIKILPAFVVNNSSNILGAAHVGTEMLMFKSNMGEGQKLIQNPKNPINWIVQPIRTVFEGVAKGAMPKDIDYKKVFSSEGLKYIGNRVGNLEDAAARERQRLKEIAIKKGEIFDPGAARLANRWSMRSTFVGLIVWTLSTFIPEKKETPDEVERMAVMRASHPMKYVGERLKQAVWVPDWGKHKRQMIGLGYVFIGISSMLGAWRGRTKNALGEATYAFNRSYFMTSLLSLFGAVPLMFGLDEKSGYGSFGTIMMGRIPFLYGSVKQKYKNDKANKGSIDGAHDYLTASVLFQLENMAQGLFGGAQKVKERLPDGTVVERIIDNQEVLEKAKEEIREIKQHRKEAKAQHLTSKDESPELSESLVVSKEGTLDLAQAGASLMVTKDGALEEKPHAVSKPAHAAEVSTHEAAVQHPAAVADEKMAAPMETKHHDNATGVHAQTAEHVEEKAPHGAHKTAEHKAPQHHAAKPATHIGGGREVHRVAHEIPVAAPSM